MCCLLSGGLQEISLCSFDHFENCGIVDKSSFASRWAIVAEDYTLSSTSELLRCNIFCLIQSAKTNFVTSCVLFQCVGQYMSYTTRLSS